MNNKQPKINWDKYTNPQIWDQKYLDRINNLIKYEPDTECWIWTGGYVGSEGNKRPCYPITKNGISTKYTLSIVALLQSVGFPDSEYHIACHKCRNIKCISPHHLEWGLESKNNGEDRKRDGTFPNFKGTRSINAKANWDQVNEIRRLYVDENQPIYKLSDKFNIGRTTISNIVKYKHYKPELPEHYSKTR